MKKLSISELYETLTDAQVRNVLLGNFSNELKKSLSNNNLKANDLQNYAEEVRKHKALAEKAKQEQAEEEKAIQEQLEAEQKAKLLAEAAARQDSIEEEKEEEEQEEDNSLQQQPVHNPKQVVNVTEENNTTQQQVSNNTQVVQQNVTQVIVQQPTQDVPKRKELSVIEIEEVVEHLNKLLDKRKKLNERLKSLNNFINQPDSDNNKFELVAADSSYSFITNSSVIIAEVEKCLQSYFVEKIKKLDTEIKAYREAHL